MDSGSEAILRRVPIFEHLDDHSLQALMLRCRRRRFPAGEALFHEGDPGHTLYVVIRGRITIESASESGESVFIGQCGPGEMFGELSLIDGQPRMADAVTSEPSELLMLNREDFLRVVEDSPRIAISVMACLARRLRSAADQVEVRQGLDVPGRLSRVLLELMQSHGVRESGGCRIDAAITQQDIARRIGATRETVNRALAGLKAVGAIQMAGRSIVIVNEARLRQYASL